MKKRLYLLPLLALLLMVYGCTRPDAEDASIKTLSVAEQPVKTWNASAIASFSGNLGYVFKGCSFSSSETSCDNVRRGTISIVVPVGARIKKAYLFWSGSGVNCPKVTIDGNLSCNTAQTQVADNVDGYAWYKNYYDLTAYASTKGSGTYTVTDLNFTANGKYCSSWSTVGTASIMVIYEQASLPDCDIHVYMPEMCSMQYPDKMLCENYRLPPKTGCGGCEEKEISVCLNWCEGDFYKPEYCRLNDSTLGDNTLNGSEAPNLDIDEYRFAKVPASRSIPLLFKGYYITGYFARYEGAYMQCVVIKVLKGTSGSVCSCLTGANGQPLANFTFQVKDAAGKLTTITTDAMGKWCQNLPAGKYVLQVDPMYQISGTVEFGVTACTCITLPCITVTPKGGGCADMDHDGVCDNVDYCPTQPGPPENGGCPQIIFRSAGDILYNTNYVSMKASANNATLTNVIATATQADQTALNEYYILSIGSFTPTVGQTYSVKSIALKNTKDYGSLLSQTFNINTNVVVKAYDPVSRSILLTFAGTFVNQAIGDAAKTYNINGTVSTTYTP